MQAYRRTPSSRAGASSGSAGASASASASSTGSAGGSAAEDLARLQREGDLEGAIALQAGRLADMNYVAERITGFKPAE